MSEAQLREKIRRRAQVRVRDISSRTLTGLHTETSAPCGVADWAFGLETIVFARTTDRVWRRLAIEL